MSVAVPHPIRVASLLPLSGAGVGSGNGMRDADWRQLFIPGMAVALKGERSPGTTVPGSYKSCGWRSGWGNPRLGIPEITSIMGGRQLFTTGECSIGIHRCYGTSARV